MVGKCKLHVFSSLEGIVDILIIFVFVGHKIVPARPQLAISAACPYQQKQEIIGVVPTNMQATFNLLTC